MSQSPETAERRARYEDAWEAINRFIREDGSWSGREHNCLHLGCDDATFVDGSAASGIDFTEDGRAFAVLDYDGDGRPDLALRSRNGPRLRILRNRFETPNRSVWFHLRGVKGNRDAVGAQIEIETGRGARLKEVKAGSAFLSQHSHWVHFGLGPAGEVTKARIRWPGGLVQELGPLEADRRYRVVEGQPPLAEPFRRPAPAPAGSGSAPPGEPPQSSPLAQVWLVESLPAPDFRLPDLEGRPHALSDFRGRPLVLLFLSPSCGACVLEVADIRTGLGAIREAGADLLGILAGAPGHTEEARDRFGAAGFPILLADEETRAAWNAIHRTLFNRARDLAVPSGFLLSGKGEIEKVYRGRMAPGELAADIRRLPLAPGSRLALALPFPGTLLGSGFHRDLFALGAALTEAGATRAAAQAFRGSLAGERSDPEVLYNLGIALADAGDLEGAARAYREALVLRPGLADALNNLGVLESRAGRAESARDHFRRALAAEPAHGEAALNLARAYLEQHDIEQAEAVYRETLRADPESAPLWSALGYLLFARGDLEGGIDGYGKALALSPSDAEAAAGLANLLLKRGGRPDLPRARRIVEEALRSHPEELGLLNALGLVLAVYEDFDGAEEAYRRAIAAAPRAAAPRLNLARLLLKRHDRAGAEKILRGLLAFEPQNAAALSLLAEIQR